MKREGALRLCIACMCNDVTWLLELAIKLEGSLHVSTIVDIFIVLFLDFDKNPTVDSTLGRISTYF